MDIEVIVLNSIFCFGIYAASFEGMILFRFVRFYERVFNVYNEHNEVNNKFFYKLSKPLYSCVICMSSIWGAIFVLVSGLTSYGVVSIEFIVHVVMVSGINYVASEMFSKNNY